LISSWLIREAHAEDAQGIASVHVRAWQAAYSGLLSEALIAAHARKRDRWWASYLKQPHVRELVLVALGDEGIAGFATTRPSPDQDAEAETAEVSGLYVDPDAWGQGIGGALLESVLDRLRVDGFKAATLWVLAANDGARRFYEKRSWTLDGAERVHPDRQAPELRYRTKLA
jgi:GNAT superfamily N-acetyltransferase